MSLHGWSWIFLILYVGVMVALGIIGSRRVSGADDFAVARRGYGPLILALAFASTAASGATFLGLPGLTYSYGVSTIWLAFLYPLGIYLGVLVCQRTVGEGGNSAGARSIPEYLGERYGSEALRVSAAVFSLMLLFYLAGQLVGGLVMFEIMLGIPKPVALAITTVVLLGYVTIGGAHADILTDGAQAVVMVLLASAIIVMFFMGVGSGGLGAMLDNLGGQDARLLEWFNPDVPITASPWSMFALVVAHIPLGLLPHIGNKLWALKDERSRNRFLVLAFIFGLILPGMALGGAMARAVLGDALMGGGANTALPALFIEIFPTWLAALLGVGILAAVMSTADGLVISTSQVFANDIYRRSIAPRWHADRSQAQLDRNVLKISRVVTALTLVGSAATGVVCYRYERRLADLGRRWRVYRRARRPAGAGFGMARSDPSRCAGRFLDRCHRLYPDSCGHRVPVLAAVASARGSRAVVRLSCPQPIFGRDHGCDRLGAGPASCYRPVDSKKNAVRATL